MNNQTETGRAGPFCPETGYHNVWPLFLLSSLIFPCSLVALLGIWRLGASLYRKDLPPLYRAVSSRSSIGKSYAKREAIWSAKVLRFFSVLVSGHTVTGKIIIVLEFVAGLVALIIYFNQVSWRLSALEASCQFWYDRPDWQIEFVCNVLLLLVYGLRFLAASSKLSYMLSLRSAVDYCTIPPVFLSIILHRNWIGLRCLRACHLLAIPDILQYFSVLKTRTVIRLAQLSCMLLTVLLVAAGIFELLENFGENISDKALYRDSDQRTYWEFVYFSIITLSTIGYGDISPKTTLGRVFCCFFVMCAVALFASSLPEVYSLASSRKKYSGSYRPQRGIGHVVVCGHITPVTVAKVLDDFNRKDRKRNDLKIVFIDREEPDLETETILKRNPSQVVFLQGTLLIVDDLKRARIEDALACLFTCNKVCDDPEKEDSTIVMTIASVKNYNPRTRCIVQLLQSKAKSLLLNIPGFGLKRGDAIICFQELELAIIAQSCMSPGSATLLLNLLRSASEDPYDRILYTSTSNKVMLEYLRGCHMDVHIEPFSSFFVGMTFSEAAAFCFTRLDLLLVGVFRPQRDNSIPGMLYCPWDLQLTSDRVGVFVATSTEISSRASVYCNECHKEIRDPRQILPCECDIESSGSARSAQRTSSLNPFDRLLSLTKASDLRNIKHKTLVKPPAGYEKKLLEHIRSNPRTPPRKPKRAGSVYETDEDYLKKKPAPDLIQLDVSGSFYWCAVKPFQASMLSRSVAAGISFSNHVVILIMAKPSDPHIGLRDLIIPMRSSKIPYDELSEIILLGDPRFLETEWPQICNLPKVTVVKGDPLNRADLRAVSVRTCRMCVALSAWAGCSADAVLNDKAAVLAALNLKAMPFDDELNSSDTEFEVPMVIQIAHEENVRLLGEHESMGGWDGKELYLNEPFMCGQAVAFCALDSLLVTSFVNPLALSVMTHLLYGIQSPRLDNLLAEGVGLVGGDVYSTEAVSEYNTRIKLLSLKVEPWSLLFRNQVPTYGALFEVATTLKMICLGLARMSRADKEAYLPSKKVIITNPSKEFALQLDDQIYFLSR